MPKAEHESEKCMVPECDELGIYEIVERCPNEGKLLCQAHAERTNYLVDRR